MFRILLIGVFLFFSFLAKGQDPHMSQTRFSSQWLNPAMIGSYDFKYRATCLYRNQWSQTGTAFTTMGFSFDASVASIDTNRIFVGVNYIHDSYEKTSFRQDFANLNIGTGVQVSKKSYLVAALGFGMINQRIDPSTFTYASQFNGVNYDPTMSNNEIFQDYSQNAFDLSAGIRYSFFTSGADKWSANGWKGNLGVSVFHLNSPDLFSLQNIENSLPPRFVLHGLFSYKGFWLGKYEAIQPSFVFMKQGSSNELVLGLAFRHILKICDTHMFGEYRAHTAIFGVDYRIDNAIIAKILFDIRDYAFGISYDFNIGSLSNIGGKKSAMEFTLRCLLPTPKRYHPDWQVY